MNNSVHDKSTSGSITPIVVAVIGALATLGAAYLGNSIGVGKGLEKAVEGETWELTEGPKEEWHGTWIVPKFGESFECKQSALHLTPLFGNCIAIRSGSYYAVRKVITQGPKNDCNYFGTRTGDSISGTYFCQNGGPYRWTVTVQ